MKRKTGYVFAAFPAIIIYLFCSNAFAGETLVLISPHWEGIRREFGQAFSEHILAETGEGVDLEWLEVGASSNILLYIRSEFTRHPEGIGVDIVWGGGGIYYRALAEDGLLEPLDISAEILGAVPKKVSGTLLRDSKGLWFGSALSSFGILYNREVLDYLDLPDPSSWRDLANPEYSGWLVLADPRHSGTSHALFEIILQDYGWDEGFSVITRSFGNSRTVTKAASQVPVLVATGQAAVGPAIDFYAWSKILEVGKDRLGFIVPTGESVINTDPIAALKGAPHSDLARRFIEFVLSEKGQKLWMLPAGSEDGPQSFTLSRLSVLPGVYTAIKGRAVVSFNPFAGKSGIEFDDDLAADRWQPLNDLIGAGMIDTHQELCKAYLSVKDMPPESTAFRRLVAPPESEEVFQNRASTWSDPEMRNQVISSWTDFFNIKYAGVEAMSSGTSSSPADRLKAGARYAFPVLIVILMLRVFAGMILKSARMIKRGLEVEKT